MELKTEKGKRKAYIRRGWILFWIFVVVIPVIGVMFSFVIPNDTFEGTFMAYIFGFSVVSFIPSLCVFGGFLGACYGRTGAQNIVLYDDELVYSIYTGSFDNRETNIFHIKKIREYTVTERNIYIRGYFKKTNVSSVGQLGGKGHRIKLARVFENEDKLIAFLDSHKE